VQLGALTSRPPGKSVRKFKKISCAIASLCRDSRHVAMLVLEKGISLRLPGKPGSQTLEWDTRHKKEPAIRDGSQVREVRTKS